MQDFTEKSDIDWSTPIDDIMNNFSIKITFRKKKEST